MPNYEVQVEVIASRTVIVEAYTEAEAADEGIKEALSLLGGYSAIVLNTTELE